MRIGIYIAALCFTCGPSLALETKNETAFCLSFQDIELFSNIVNTGDKSAMSGFLVSKISTRQCILLKKGLTINLIDSFYSNEVSEPIAKVRPQGGASTGWILGRMIAQ